MIIFFFELEQLFQLKTDDFMGTEKTTCSSSLMFTVRKFITNLIRDKMLNLGDNDKESRKNLIKNHFVEFYNKRIFLH